MQADEQQPWRCFGNGENQQLLAQYHDQEWGVPVHDDNKHFAMLTLEGAQAGLNWETILKRREGYYRAFLELIPEKVALMTDSQLEALMQNPDIIRNRRKIFSVRKNAQAFLAIQSEFSSFDNYVWAFVNNQPKINRWPSREYVPVTTIESHALSKDLKKRGMIFVGPVIMYAYMQATGLVNDHVKGCCCYVE